VLTPADIMLTLYFGRENLNLEWTKICIQKECYNTNITEENVG
jgi:hypothetical protein